MQSMVFWNPSFQKKQKSVKKTIKLFVFQGTGHWARSSYVRSRVKALQWQELRFSDLGFLLMNEYTHSHSCSHTHTDLIDYNNCILFVYNHNPKVSLNSKSLVKGLLTLQDKVSFKSHYYQPHPKKELGMSPNLKNYP
jgi:hypothetical protein